MRQSLSAFIGLRFLLAKSKNRFISFISMSSMLGIAVGIMVLTIILSAMNGFERELTQRLLSVVPHAEMSAVKPPMLNWRQQIEQATDHRKVEAGAPYIKLNALIMQGEYLKGLDLIGVLPEFEQQVSSLKKYVSKAAWQSLTANNGAIILGQGIIKDLGLSIGDKVFLMLPPAHYQGRLKALKSVSFTLAGAFKFGGQLDYSQAYIHLSDAQKINDYPQGVDGVRLKLTNVFNAQEIIRDVAIKTDEPLYISDWSRSQGHLYNDIVMVKFITYLVLVLVIGVASFNIVSTLVMAVQDKESEIAILITMGLTQGRVMRIFIIQGMLNALLGCVLGSLSGYIISVNLSAVMNWFEQTFSIQFLSGDVYFIDFLPTQFQWQDLMLLVLSTLLISFFATLYPARKAATIEPAQVLGQ